MTVSFEFMMMGECTMRKRLTPILLCFFMCVTLIPVSAQATETAKSNAPEIPTEGDVWDGSIVQPTKLVQKDGVYYYEITRCSELAYVAQTGEDWLSRNYILENNLILNNVILTWDETGMLLNDMESLLPWTPIGKFSGLFDGNGFCISGAWVRTSGLFGALDFTGEIKDLILVNSSATGGGIVGGSSLGSISGCVFDGRVSGSNDVGGITGSNSGPIENCINYGTIVGVSNSTFSAVGGITGDANSTSGSGYFSRSQISNCMNYGSVSGNTNIGGIVGRHYTGNVVDCINYGVLTGTQYIGGITGYSTSALYRGANLGLISGNNDVGGIAGFSNDSISNCYNTALIEGNNNVGGIVGSSNALTMINCYNIGNVKPQAMPSGGYLGAIAGSDNILWNPDTVSGCFYLQNDTINANLFGCGGIATSSLEPEGLNPRGAAELQLHETFTDWDFNETWSISPDINGGYPYLQWQESALSDTAVGDVEISKTALALTVGDCTYLTATVSPFNASDKSVVWKSSDSDIATVSAAGKVTAVSAGTAIITATTVDGGYTASCAVTVTERLAEEYKINSITVRDNDGAVLSAIPNGDCLATVSIKNLASEGNTLVFLAAYTSTGQYQGMLWVSVEDLPVGATIKVSLPVDNSDGKIANLKAFTVASFSNLTPLGEAVSFLP